MIVSFKKLVDEAVLPFYSTSEAAGLDMTATSKSYDEFGNVVYGTGLAGKIPEGYVGLLFPRSSNAKKDLILSNSVGVWDADYIGEIFFKFKPSAFYYDNECNQDSDYFDSIVLPNEDTNWGAEYEIGDRIGQLLIIPYPKIEPEFVNELPTTERGDKGWGSTGA
jgi:dUTP pyrophosphatase